MQTAIRLTTHVLPGGRVEVSDAQLLPGTPVDVFVVPQVDEASRPTIVDVLAMSPGHLAFQTAEEVDAYVREERDAWER